MQSLTLSTAINALLQSAFVVVIDVNYMFHVKRVYTLFLSRIKLRIKLINEDVYEVYCRQLMLTQIDRITG